MHNPRRRILFLALGALVAAWMLAWGGYHLATESRMTSEKMAAYLRAHRLSEFEGKSRRTHLEKLARNLNALTMEERRKVRLDREWARWFNEMNDEEKIWFIEETMPSGFRQMLSSFEKLPDEKRRKAVDEAMKRLKSVRDGDLPPERIDRDGAVLNDELRQKVVTTGLQTFYSQSSAQTKAELAPVLEELQRMMESGLVFRR